MLTKERKVGAFCLTEADAGSDASKGTTTAVLDGDHYILNGSKIFITNGYVADIFIVFAMTDRSKGNKKASLHLSLRKDFPGFLVGKHEVKMGLHGSPTSEIIFQDCIVPKENLLGVEGKGFGIAMATLDGGRIGIAAQALGSQKVLTRGYGFAKFVFSLADRSPNSRIPSWYLLICMLALKQAGCSPTRRRSLNTRNVLLWEAATAKLFCSELANKTATKALQMCGGYGYTNDYPLERMMRDAKITEIYEGTSEDPACVVISGNILN